MPDRTNVHRPTRAGSVSDQVRLAALLLPAAAVGLVLKAIRLAHLPSATTAWTGGLALMSDLAFAGSWTIGWWAVLTATRGRATRRAVLIAAHLATWLLTVLLVLAHEYWMRTGDILILDRGASAWRSRHALTPLLASQIDRGLVVKLVVVTIVCIVLPLVLVAAGRLLRARTVQPARRNRGRAALGLALALGLFAASSWTLPTASSRFARAPVTNLVVGTWEQRVTLSQVKPPPPTPSAPLTLTGKPDGRNVVLIVLESQRPTSTLPATARRVTPFLDALATRSLTAAQAYPVMPHTSKSLTAIHCGVAPPLDNANSEAGEHGIADRCLPDLLASEGYRTAFFQSATEKFERRRELVNRMGFETFDSADTLPTQGYGRVNYFGYEDDIMLQPSRAWMQGNRDHPFLVSYLTVTAHHDYRQPPGSTPQHFVDDPEMNSYLNGLAYQDRFVRRVVDQVKDLGLYDKTIFVVVGDHGEGFGEHGRRQHDNTMYEEGIRVPLIVHDPLAKTALTVTDPVQQTAILPTVTDILGYRLHGTRPGGSTSLRSTAPRNPVTVSCFEQLRCLARLDGDLKYIYHFNDRRAEVYDLAADPGETRDLQPSADPAWLAAQQSAVLRWRASVEQTYRDLRTSGHPK